MTLDLTPALLVAFLVFLGVSVWWMVRRRNHRSSGPFPDVPDAPATAVPIEAPGVTPAYSSLDPFAPPKPNRSSHRLPKVP